MTLSDIKNYIYKRARTDSTSLAAADLVILLNQANRQMLAHIRDVTDNFLPTDWTSGDLSTGTLTPIFDSEFHELIPLKISAQITADDGKQNAGALQGELAVMLERFKKFYSTRSYRICTITIAAPGVISRKNHGLKAGDRVIFSTSSALPTGITANTWYWVISAGLGDDDFEISATKTGSAITTTGSQSGTHWFAVDVVGRMIPNVESCR